MTAHPLAADVLADQLDVYVLKRRDEEQRLRLLQSFTPEGGQPNDMLATAIQRTERNVTLNAAIVADIRGALEKLRTP